MSIKIGSNGGIGNRLRTMVGYAAVYKKQGKQSPVFVWKNTKHAPPNHGAYLINGAEIIDVDKEDDETVMVPGTIDIGLMFRTHGLYLSSRQAELDAYGLIEFSDAVKERASVVYNTAIHLRMTDIASKSRLKRFREWLAKSDIPGPVYLACDEKKTYEALQAEFDIVNQSTFIDLQNSLRKTSVEDAATDMLNCINANYFLGTKGSSFSDMIIKIRKFRQKSNHGTI